MSNGHRYQKIRDALALEQPEALRLADHLEQFRSFPDDLAAAAELRRLHTENEAKDALLRQALEALEELQYAVADTAQTDDVSLYYRTIAAISAALAEPTCKDCLQVAEQQGPDGGSGSLCEYGVFPECDAAIAQEASND